MSRVEENKQQKKKSLMDTAFTLFTHQGITKTSISDIAEKAGMAKGTFYLYFRDKYDLQDKLIVHKSEQLFQHALDYSGYEKLSDPMEQLFAVIDDILFQLKKNPLLMRFLGKNLSWHDFQRVAAATDSGLLEEIMNSTDLDQKTLELEVFTVLELVGSTCNSVILSNEPVSLEEYLPWLHRALRAILESFHAAAGDTPE